MPTITAARIAILGLLGIFSLNANAHFYAESPACNAPKKPLEFVTELDKKEFDQKVEKYRQCLESFVKQQNKAMAVHKQSADKAAAIWKSYVENVLGKKLLPAEQPQPTTPTSPSEVPAPAKP